MKRVLSVLMLVVICGVISAGCKKHEEINVEETAGVNEATTGVEDKIVEVKGEDCAYYEEIKALLEAESRNDMEIPFVEEDDNAYILSPEIKRIHVRAENEYIDDEGSRAYREGLYELYEDTYFPEHVSGAGKTSYVEGNQEMIIHSKFCVVYYDENYLPPRRKNSRRDLFDYQPKSGTAVAYEYAVRKKKQIINILT